ncbi:MAG: tRNA lysidine(34) synthetase TilS [Chlamydiia bacterium]|nr:tRNA lysidine(34) synthetase TilS [Chlamydiia bacterium]
MNIKLKKYILDMFTKCTKYKIKFPVTISFSGGADSLCLLYCMMEKFGKKEHGDIHVVIIEDTEFNSRNDDFKKFLRSVEDIENIKVHSVSGPLSTESIKNADTMSDMQNSLRHERYAILKDIYHSNNCKTLLLGHNADDRAETVFKRIFESSFIANIYGMTDVGNIHGMNVLRPLIGIRKSRIGEFVESLSIVHEKYKYSGGNRDIIKTEILPMISECFGKDVVNPLCRISHQSKMVHDYLNAKTSSSFDNLVFEKDLCYIKLEDFAALEELERYFLTKKIASSLGVTISYESMKDFLKCITSERSAKISLSKGFIHVTDTEIIISPMSNEQE